MSPVHRPLCEWVADVPVEPDGSAEWDPWAEPNGGERWSDARWMNRFSTGWRREPVTLRIESGERSVLGLVGDDRVVVELDDTAAPLPVSAEALELVDRYERSWPDVRPRDGDRDTLAAASPVLVHALLDRIAAEAPDADPALFHALPWDLVITLATDVAQALGSREPRPAVPSPIRLRHWFTPTGSRFSAALDQINAGIADRSPALVREGATALCVRLSEADLSRFPGPARAALAAVVRRLGASDPLLVFTAERAVRRLEGTTGVAATRTGPSMVVQTELELAASGSDARELNVQLQAGPLTVDGDVTEGGMLSITAEYELSSGQTSAVLNAYGTAIVRLRLTDDEDRSQAVLIPLASSPIGLSGAVDLAVTGGTFTVDLDGPPIGSAETWELEPRDVAASYRIADEETKEIWRGLSASAPAAHPVARALRDQEEDE